MRAPGGKKRRASSSRGWPREEKKRKGKKEARREVDRAVFYRKKKRLYRLPEEGREKKKKETLREKANLDDWNTIVREKDDRQCHFAREKGKKDLPLGQKEKNHPGDTTTTDRLL